MDKTKDGAKVVGEKTKDGAVKVGDEVTDAHADLELRTRTSWARICSRAATSTSTPTTTS